MPRRTLPGPGSTGAETTPGYTFRVVLVVDALPRRYRGGKDGWRTSCTEGGTELVGKEGGP